jgi:hypothetical protein
MRRDMEPYVFARRIGAGDFRAPAGATLHGVPLRPGVGIPRHSVWRTTRSRMLSILPCQPG